MNTISHYTHSRKKNLSIFAGMVVAAALVTAVTGCRKTPPPPKPTPPKVTVAKVVQQEVLAYHDFTGTTDAVSSVVLQARVPGFLVARDFKDGDFVKKGDRLFMIEQVQYKAALQGAEASLAAAKAEADRAEQDYKRVLQAFKTNAVSQQEVSSRHADFLKATADVAKEEAAKREAEIELGYTEVFAPFDGKMSDSYYSVGNMVGNAGTTDLARLVSIDPINVKFNVNERLIEELLAKIPIEKKGRSRMKVLASLESEEGFPHEGVIDYVDNTVDSDTGTILVRAKLPNDKLLIIPGMFMRIRVPDPEPTKAILVEERAVGTDLAGKYILVVNDDNVVEHRAVVLGQLFGDKRAIEKGLAPGERYVVNGLQMARPGLPVTPQEQGASKPEKEKTKEKTPKQPKS